VIQQCHAERSEASVKSVAKRRNETKHLITQFKRESFHVAQNLLTQSNKVNTYYVYIMTNRSKTLYTGVTNDLYRRVYEHKQKLIPGFTQKYNINRLVYYEETSDVREAIAREKQIKGWLRAKKIALIESANPQWHDLSADWFET